MEYSGVVVVLLVVGLCVAPVAATASVVPERAVVDDPAAVQESFDRNAVQLTIYTNRSARWTFHYERTLSNETERQNFESFAQEFNSTEMGLYTRFKNDSTVLAREGANLTGRDMQATNFSRRAYVTSNLGNNIGVVEMSFTWTAFATGSNDRVVIGDVFEGGLYLGSQQSLVVSPGPNLRFQDVSPDGTQSNSSSLAASDSVTWQGEREFTDNRPQVVFVPASTEEDGGLPGGDGGSDGGTTVPGTSESSGIWLAGVVSVLLLGGAAAVWYLRQRPEALLRGGSEEGTNPNDASVTPAVSEEELLTDEDRVVTMLERSGGRMKQVNIVKETGWSKSKVSMLLSEMEDEGRISKLRVGRENVISLKGHEPEAARSPFDDE